MDTIRKNHWTPRIHSTSLIDRAQISFKNSKLFWSLCSWRGQFHYLSLRTKGCGLLKMAWAWHYTQKTLFWRVGRDHVFLFCLLCHSIIKCDSYFITKCNKAYFCYETRRYTVLESKVRMGFACKDCNYSTKMKKVFDSLKKEKSQLYLKKWLYRRKLTFTSKENWKKTIEYCRIV